MDTTPESALRTRLGLNRNQMRTLRKMHIPEKCIEKKGREIHITKKGIELLEAALKLAPTAPQKAPGGNTTAQESKNVHPDPIVHDPEVFTFKIRRIVTNPHIVEATDGKEIFRVRVKSSHHWKRNMPIRCVHVRNDLYELVGRSPRYTGRF